MTRPPSENRTGAEGLPEFRQVREVAKAFGVSPMTIYRAIHEGQFPAVQIRGRFVVPARAVVEMSDAAMSLRTTVNAADWVNRTGGQMLL
ncbi:hypothetical protein Lesp02_02570 [Lentzea sp. NBRC 105346]|uniref:helix-turn-helix domain-containing protein n=1 Tax=Lentzea sp. NBRC 105346 TaxID=3032205 RepID=UPI0024A16692|nr:helix-turn-helix domain-containing protein [Lentzea sp. NBRC 105346]GLZ28067.1 hypothetical protein Lesp02_02570 [Lentzea sp. NBRC 105346]